MYHVPVLFFIQTPLDLMMRPAPVDPAGRKCDHSEHPRSTTGAPSELGRCFWRHQKTIKKKHRFLEAFLVHFGSQNGFIFASFCTYFLVYFSMKKWYTFSSDFRPPSECTNPRICWQGQYFHRVGASRASFNVSSKMTLKTSKNNLIMEYEMYYKNRLIF